MVLLEYQNIKIFLQKVTLWIGVKKFLWLKKLKILCHLHVVKDLNGEKNVGTFFPKKNCKKQISYLKAGWIKET